MWCLLMDDGIDNWVYAGLGFCQIGVREMLRQVKGIGKSY